MEQVHGRIQASRRLTPPSDAHSVASRRPLLFASPFPPSATHRVRTGAPNAVNRLI